MSDWISVEDQEPESGRKVIATYKNEHGKWRQIFAEYVDRWSEVDDCDGVDTCSEYSEERDEYYLLEGWYERVENYGDFMYVKVDDNKITHWKPLDPPPTQPER